MSETNDTAPPAEPRRRNRPGAGRPKDRTSYAGLYADLQSRVRHARITLAEAAAASPETAKALINVALRTLGEE